MCVLCIGGCMVSVVCVFGGAEGLANWSTKEKRRKGKNWQKEIPVDDAVAECR